MNNISTLFENLMTYNNTNDVKKIEEDDSTILNLAVELPPDTSDIKPNDVKVDVGVMEVEKDEDEDKVNIESDEKEEVPEEDTKEENKDEKDDKEESLKLRKEAIRKRRLEAKELKKNKLCACTGKPDCECEACKSKNKVEEKTDVETAKANIRKRVNGIEECDSVKKESLMRLDTNSLNKLITQFVRDNYKNIDKVVISKAILENKKLTLTGKIINSEGLSENISLVNKGFDSNKLQNKRFIIDFKDNSNTFNIVKESLSKPFIFTATLKEGILKFEKLKYSFNTKLSESKIANVSGNCNILKESKTHKYNRSTFLKEATLKPMSGTDLLNYQGANNFSDGTKPFIAEGKGGTFLIAGSDEKDGKALITIYYGPDGDQWAWKSYSDKETALEDGRLLVNLIDKEINIMQLKRFGFELM